MGLGSQAKATQSKVFQQGKSLTFCRRVYSQCQPSRQAQGRVLLASVPNTKGILASVRVASAWPHSLMLVANSDGATDGKVHHLIVGYRLSPEHKC